MVWQSDTRFSTPSAPYQVLKQPLHPLAVLPLVKAEGAGDKNAMQ